MDSGPVASDSTRPHFVAGEQRTPSAPPEPIKNSLNNLQTVLDDRGERIAF